MESRFQKWYKDNKVYFTERQKEYRNTPKGRAFHLVDDYKREDIKCNRGECTLTAQWIVDNIFSKPCAHCGKTGWKIIGCNRINNDLPHTPDNVEPCCRRCNSKFSGGRPKMPIEQIDIITGQVVRVWNSVKDARNFGFNHISDCLNGKIKQDKGYTFRRTTEN